MTAGTIFHGTRLSLGKSFLAIYVRTQPRESLSALELLPSHFVEQYNSNYGSLMPISSKKGRSPFHPKTALLGLLQRGFRKSGFRKFLFSGG